MFFYWQQCLVNSLKAAQAKGDISMSANYELLAEYFWVDWERAVSRAKLVQQTTPLDNYLNQFILGLPK